ncbi:MAG TPA: BatA domain-containing protein [Gemmatimonadaceae bacterium]|nr:BatA domain-containing protein [Gemmatimonadaceae bacterium]
MIWQNPIAWFGLGGLAIPIVIHLLNRRSARVQRFPTLRFFAMSPVIAPRRRQLSELLLLAVRLLILLAAVAALALRRAPVLADEGR